MSANTSAHDAAQSASEQAKPQPPLIPPADNPTVDVLVGDLNDSLAPFQSLSDPNASTLEKVNAAIGGTLGLLEAPVTLLNDGFAAVTNAIASAFPAFPAATLGAMHLGFPHVHTHPPAMPFPLPSIGAVALAGCASVLINGVPAARAGDIGIALGCGSVSPPFEVYTGSSKVFIGGARAARLLDITRHCQPGAGATKAASLLQKAAKIAGDAMDVVGTGAGVLNAVTEEVKANKADKEAAAAATEEEARQKRDEAEAGHESAKMAGIQAGLDAAAMAMGMLMGLDPGTPPCIGAVLTGAPNVLIGGFPMPPWTDFAKGLGKLAKGLKVKAPKKKHANHECESEGHPIDPVTGANFDHFVDYEDPESSLAFRWVRHYTSADAGREGPMGRGFRHGYERSLQVDLDRAVYTDDKGRTVELPLPGDDEEKTVREGYVLWIQEAGETLTYTISRADEPTMEFVRERRAGGTPRLARLRAKDARMDFQYDARGRLSVLIEVSASGEIETRLVLDPKGHIVEVRRGPRGQRELPLLTAYGYDRAGCLTGWQDALGAKGSYAYDAGPRLTRMTDRNGYSFHFRYDGQGRCVEARGDDGLWAVSLRYEPENRRTLATRANGGVWIHEYDENGTIVCVTDPYGGKRQRVVDEEGKVVREVGPDGQTNLHFLYDDDGYHSGVEDRFGYRHPPLDQDPNPPDPLELRVAATALEQQWGTAVQTLPIVSTPAMDLLPAALGPTPGSRTPSRRRDGLGRVLEETHASGHRVAWDYDANGNQVSHIDRDGRKHRTKMTSWNLPGAEIDPLGHCTRYDYTAHENVSRIVDPGGSESRYEYDLKDQLVRVVRHGVVREEYVRDPGGRLVEKRDGAGNVLLRRSIGANGLPTERRLGSGEVYRYAYDDHGRVTRASLGSVEVRRAFDRQGRLISDERDGLGVKHRFAGMALRETTYFGRFTVTYHRAPDGSLVINTPSGGTHRIRRGTQRRIFAELGSGTEVWSSYDEDGRCQGRELRRTRDDQVAPLSVRYTYSAEGELHRIEDSMRGVTEYTYDAAHRLIGEATADGTATTIVLDAAGNVREKPGLSSVELLEGNRLRAARGERFRYDARNYLVEISTDDGQTTRYRYNSLDMLVGVSTSEHGESWTATYDGLRRRTHKVHGGRRTEFYWDEHRLAAEVSPDGAVRIYVYAGPEALVPILFIDYASMDSPPQTGRAFYPIGNQLGVPIHIEDQAGNIVWRAERIEPYGALIVAPGASIAYALRFPGHCIDEETGLHYNRFRYYSPRLGRYLQSDPIGQSGGINLYAYPANPMVDVDVLGLTKEPHVRPPPEDSLHVEVEQSATVATAAPAPALQVHATPTPRRRNELTVEAYTDGWEENSSIVMDAENLRLAWESAAEREVVSGNREQRESSKPKPGKCSGKDWTKFDEGMSVAGDIEDLELNKDRNEKGIKLWKACLETGETVGILVTHDAVVREDEDQVELGIRYLVGHPDIRGAGSVLMAKANELHMTDDYRASPMHVTASASAVEWYKDQKFEFKENATCNDDWGKVECGCSVMSKPAPPQGDQGVLSPSE